MAVNESEDQPTGPPSIRQKQILDVAADNPDAPMEDLANEIPSATTELVERVLEEYGDPADGKPEESPEEADSATDESITPGLNDLSPKQREVLRAIYERPTAPQRELADALDVSGSTVSNRVNSIEGFHWDNREAFVETMFETDPKTTTVTPPMASNGTGSKVVIDQLTDRLTTVEQQLADLTNADADESRAAFDEFADLKLTHKIAHACLTSDAITEDEELQIMKALLR